MLQETYDHSLKTFYNPTDKEKKQKVPRKNNYGRQLRRWHNDTGEYNQPGRNTTA